MTSDESAIADPSQRTVARGSQSERRCERPGKVGLIGESRVAGDFGQWVLPVNPLPCELQTAHQQIAVRAGAEHDPELARQVIPCQSRDRLQLRRMHDTGPLARSTTRLSMANDSRGTRKASSTACDSLAFVDTGSLTKGSG